MKKQAFIDAMMPFAIREGQRTGVDPRIIIAQSALESAWGEKAPGNAYFGVKSHGKPGGQVLATQEVIGGKRVRTKDSFRRYGGMSDAARGYGDFILNNPRYSGFRAAQGLEAQTQELQKSRYASSPAYGKTVLKIARKIPMQAPSSRSSSPFAPLSYANQGAIRRLPLVDSLQKSLQEGVYAVYGPGYSVQVYSGGQPHKGSGKRRTGSIRHDGGRAADIHVVGPDGKRVSGAELAKFGQYWAAKKLGGVGMEMHGAGIHLDDWTKPPPGGGMHWNYAAQGGQYTPEMRAAISAGLRGQMPMMYAGAQGTDPTSADMAGAPVQATIDPLQQATLPQPNPMPRPAAPAQMAGMPAPSKVPDGFAGMSAQQGQITPVPLPKLSLFNRSDATPSAPSAPPESAQTPSSDGQMYAAQFFNPAHSDDQAIRGEWETYKTPYAKTTSLTDALMAAMMRPKV